MNVELAIFTADFYFYRRSALRSPRPPSVDSEPVITEHHPADRDCLYLTFKCMYSFQNFPCIWETGIVFRSSPQAPPMSWVSRISRERIQGGILIIYRGHDGCFHTIHLFGVYFAPSLCGRQETPNEDICSFSFAVIN